MKLKTVIDSRKSGSFSLTELKRYKSLLWFLSLRDILVRYKQTWAGVLWAVFKPAINIVIFGFLAQFIEKNNAGSMQFIQVASGIIMWQLISSALTEVSSSLVSNSNIITKVYFPKILIPLSTLLVCCTDFLISFGIVIILQLFIVGLPSIYLILFPLVVVWALLFSLAFGLWLSALNVKYRDIKFVLPFFIQLGFYVSPVFLSTRFFMELNIPHWLKFIFNLNPIVGILDVFRFLFSGEWYVYDWTAFLCSIALTFLLMIFGFRYFYRFEKNFADYI